MIDVKLTGLGKPERSSSQPASRVLIRDETLQKQALVVLVCVLTVTAGHWLLPSGADWLHGFHIALRKSYFVPVILCAFWFGRTTTYVVTLLITLNYVPYLLSRWQGHTAENLNQVGELLAAWALALLASELFRREKEALVKAASIHAGALVALVRALDVREHNTQRHSLRVRAYTLRLCDELNIGSEQRSMIGRAALLHDIGKIGIPDSILLKRGPLSKQERIRMQVHAEIGASILESVPSTATESQIISCHHERFDGNGYPSGLKGEAIPIGARIFAVADVFDALTSRRPYRDAISIESALTQIAKGSGSHFDPFVVKAAERIPPAEWKAIRDKVEGDRNCESSTTKLATDKG